MNDKPNHLDSLNGVMSIGGLSLRWDAKERHYIGEQDGRVVTFPPKGEYDGNDPKHFPKWEAAAKREMSLARLARLLSYPRLDRWRPFSVEDIKEFGRP